MRLPQIGENQRLQRFNPITTENVRAAGQLGRDIASFGSGVQGLASGLRQFEKSKDVTNKELANMRARRVGIEARNRAYNYALNNSKSDGSDIDALYFEKYNELVKKDGILNDYKDQPELLRQIDERVKTFRAEFLPKVFSASRKKFLVDGAQKVNSFISSTTLSIKSSPDLNSYREEVNSFKKSMDNFVEAGFINKNDASSLQQQASKDFAKSYIRGLLEKNKYDEADAALASIEVGANLGGSDAQEQMQNEIDSKRGRFNAEMLAKQERQEREEEKRLEEAQEKAFTDLVKDVKQSPDVEKVIDIEDKAIVSFADREISKSQLSFIDRTIKSAKLTFSQQIETDLMDKILTGAMSRKAMRNKILYYANGKGLDAGAAQSLLKLNARKEEEDQRDPLYSKQVSVAFGILDKASKAGKGPMSSFTPEDTASINAAKATLAKAALGKTPHPDVIGLAMSLGNEYFGVANNTVIAGVRSDEMDTYEAVQDVAEDLTYRYRAGIIGNDQYVEAMQKLDLKKNQLDAEKKIEALRNEDREKFNREFLRINKSNNLGDGIFDDEEDETPIMLRGVN